ncbi:hypothetical protein Tco_1114546 [Tanacetum coccineum]|uniref:Uncharacterized protein n=1 Tax=Tanacetum coccineum TaxID=301880 RepID=A0ABQ5IVF4_9ASTR
MSHFKGMSYEDIRPIFERVWDQNQAFIPMDSEIEKEVMKRSRFDLQQESSKPVKEEIVQQDDVVPKQVMKESSKTARGRRKKSLARKRAKETLSEEKEESLNIESLATKYPIVDWETQILENDQYYYQIKRTDGNVKHYKIFSAMLYDFDRQDVLELYRLVKDRFQTASPEGVKESPKTPLFHDDPLHDPLYEDSTSQGSTSMVRPSHTLFKLIGRWTKDHPIANVIGDPSRSVSTRKQLKTDAMWCYFDAFLTSIEPKNFKQAMTEPS